MKNLYVLLILFVLAACGNPEADSGLEAKKKELESARNEMISLKEKIGTLEKEIVAMDPTFARNNNAVLISTWTLEAKPFAHFVDVRGAVESRKNVSLSAMTGGKVDQVYVREGQSVTAGQVLVSLEADILNSTIAELKTSLELATTIYEKQEKLWAQKIGSEVQYLQAKNNKESLEKRLEVAKAQLDQTMVKAPFSGTIDRVDALVGEMASPGIPLVRMVNPNDMYVKADVSEDFIGKLKAGDGVEIFFPAFDKKIKSTILSVGQVINAENRTFRVEARLENEVNAKPNQVVVISVRDYVNPKVFQIPTKILQRDSEGQYVFRIENQENTPVAKKVYVEPGLSYDGLTEILKGLTGTEQLVYEGFREVTEGAELKIAKTEKTVVASK
ncbi:MAG: efflux RND transporter periplasmic adaptor subunit [Cyclobacteriaceae bacterium]|nr:efflux RND transporter periplasmic adaptor subunit [Cyclobacteriaceae bacterium]